MSGAIHPFYLRHVGSEALLDSDEEMALANEVWEARNELAALVAVLPAELQHVIPDPPPRASMPEWSFDRIGQLRDRLLRLPAEDRALASDAIEMILEQAGRYEKARTRLILSNLRLVIHVAMRRDNKAAMIDLIQEGNLGLMRAIDRFDPSRGNRFGTYAFWWVKQGIDRFLTEKRRLIRLPANVDEMHRRVSRLQQQHSELTGRDAEPAELARIADIPEKQVQRLLRLAQEITPVDSAAGRADGEGWLENVRDDRDPSPQRRMELDQRSRHVRELLRQFPERDQQIVKLRFGIDCDGPHSLQKIAGNVRVSRERVRQILKTILRKMRKASSHEYATF
jgi:RNA polymerase sigma factor (sigma-70 family)